MTTTLEFMASVASTSTSVVVAGINHTEGISYNDGLVGNDETPGGDISRSDGVVVNEQAPDELPGTHDDKVDRELEAQLARNLWWLSRCREDAKLCASAAASEIRLRMQQAALDCIIQRPCSPTHNQPPQNSAYSPEENYD